MMKADCCTYAPRLAADVEIAEQRDGDRLAFVIGSLSVGRFLLLGETEEKVRRLLDGERTPADVCAEFERQHKGVLSLPTLSRFLAKLDEAGILAGERAHRPPPPDQLPSTQFYWRFKLFNPDRLFAHMVEYLRWIWTPGFVYFSAAFMLTALLLALANRAEVANYSLYAVREHFLMILIASELIALSHEFAHGLTCKAFGGRVPEVGVLQIYYVLPALYCNVSGIHLIPQRNRRLWVILAGIYWQVLVGTAALLAWFLFAPYNFLSDLAFCIFLAGVVDVIFNANPLIKLDGYYFLSQWLRLPNLMDRSRAYWRGLLKRMLFGERGVAESNSRRERAIYAAFGLLSFTYTVGLRTFIVFFIGSYLADWFHTAGLLLAACLSLFYARHPLRQLGSAAISMISRRSTSLFKKRGEGAMASEKQEAAEKSAGAQWKLWRRRLVPLTAGLVIVLVLCLPWSASVGSYGTLMAIPGEEAIIRAPESAALISLHTQPGQQVGRGFVVGEMGSPDLEDQILEAQSELARAQADYDRLFGELRARNEAATRAELQLRQRQRDYDELQAEQQQIAARRSDGAEGGVPADRTVLLRAAMPVSTRASDSLPVPAVPAYPAALAALEAEVNMRRAQLDEAATKRRRVRALFAEGLTPQSELDAAETRVAVRASEWQGALKRLTAALVEHRRKHVTAAADLELARSDAGAERLQIAKFADELRAVRGLIGTLEGRRDQLERRRAQFALVTPMAGMVFGEDLRRRVGQYFETIIVKVAQDLE